MPLTAGQVLQKRYRIVKLLGQGGFGAVYRAWDINLNRVCAVKENLDISPEAQRQFNREAMLLANLSHPNLARVLDYFFLPEQGQYLVMDFVEGLDLQEMLEQRGSFDEAQVLQWMNQVLDGLIYLHRQTPPVIHRDIKPANIRITPQGKAILVDFGIAKIWQPGMRTTQGARAVTPGYSPHEQYGSTTTDARTDVYSLAATAYALLTGQVPPEVMDRISGTELPAPGSLKPGISPHVSQAILRALEIQPANRFQTVVEFKAALAAPVTVDVAPPKNQTSASMPRKPWQWLVGAGLGLLTVGAVFLVLISRLTLPGSGTSPFDPKTETPLKTITPGGVLPTATGYVMYTRIRTTDGMVEVFVPEGDFVMGTESSYTLFAGPEHSVYLDRYWIDQTEVTNVMYARCVAAGACSDLEGIERSSQTRDDYYDNPIYADYPVQNVDWFQADAYCRWAGAQLPTEAQWEKAARGVDGRTYPWGEGIDCTHANFYGKDEGCIGDTTRVRSYPSGASPYGAYDMVGNVSEWVADWYAEDYYSSLVEWINPRGPAVGVGRVRRGGNYWDIDNFVKSPKRDGLEPSASYMHDGIRCVRTDEIVEAVPTPTAEIVVTAVPPTATVVAGATRERARDGMVEVFVPAGNFTMGSTAGDLDEQPVHTVYLDGFWIDQTEVTNGMYALCEVDGDCSIPLNQKSSTREIYYGNSDYLDYPVIYVDWRQADTYCRWAGGQLPSEAQWEKAARGEDGRLYPWGNQPPDGSRANFSPVLTNTGDTKPVGSYPAGASPYGALDMAGNVSEWVADLYDESYYSSLEDWNNPPGPVTGLYRVFRGGAWTNYDAILRSASRYFDPITFAAYYHGFRCARTD
ncbi:MAG: SUMF1/EgtB/PvdO family nonheme iron enzyme [Anaerolineae bacterium]|nr:SUMF1/EgtB/PvdO family nonheme iron enzyme [Anaerolineae bacterium]